MANLPLRPSGFPYPGALLVASISEANQNNKLRFSPNEWFTRPSQQPSSTSTAFASSSQVVPSTFQNHSKQGQGQDLEPRSAAAANDVSCDDFRVHSRRQHHALTLQLQALLQLQQRMDSETSRLITMFRTHVLPRVSALLAAQHRFMAQVDKSRRHWAPRNPFRRHKAADAGSPNLGTRAAARQAQKLMDMALQAERSLDPEAAAAHYEAAAELTVPRSADLLARAAKQWSDMSYLEGVPAPRVVELNTKAVDLATEAVTVNPDSALGYIARCVSRGRLALCLDTKSKVQIAKLACDDAKAAIACDPNNDLAHHLLGRWNYEMAGINGVARYLVKVVYGTTLMTGSYPEALACYRNAVALHPTRLIHRVEVGRTLAKLGQKEEAVKELEHSLTLEVEDLNAHLQKEDAKQMLQKLKQSNKQALWLSQLTGSNAEKTAAGS